MEYQTKRFKQIISYDHILEDYRIAYASRHVSLLGRKEVLTGKASFGIFGEGIEVPSVALCHAFQNGDYKSGYYRDQTIAFRSEQATFRDFFAQLYAHADPLYEPHSSGRQMSSFLCSKTVNEEGAFLDPFRQKNIISEVACTAGQMPRLLGLAYASKFYRSFPETFFSRGGQEVVFGTIGDAATSEGLFFETMNAAAVLQVPLVMSVWDNDYGISVHKSLQTVHASISEALHGFKNKEQSKGLRIYEVSGWDYESLVETYLIAAQEARESHQPSLIHVSGLTQPQGHSTSGSHERYKSQSRLSWEKAHDCLPRFRVWVLENKIATEKQLNELEKKAVHDVKEAAEEAWHNCLSPFKAERDHLITLLNNSLTQDSRVKSSLESKKNIVLELINQLNKTPSLYRRVIEKVAFQGAMLSSEISEFYKNYTKKHHALYNSHLYSQTSLSPLKKEEIKPLYTERSDVVDGRVIIMQCFDLWIKKDPRVFILGEDVGSLGGVNLEFEGLYEKHGSLRISDTGIREATILGQGIGCALRGLKPIVDIQYLDYMLYALQTASDDLASLLYRTRGIEKAPVIIRTKGHRLEGIWHTGSPLSCLLGALRGVYICVPRNMTQAAGFYNTLLQGDQPALVIEVLNGYRLKEKVPENLCLFSVPLGEPEILRLGSDLTLVTYGACCRIALEAARTLESFGVHIEVIDVQTLLPFDLTGIILQSLKKTHAVVFFDEDVPGGATAYMLQIVLEQHKGFDELDCPPRTLTAAENRVAYGRDADYYSKPNEEDVVKICLEVMASRHSSFQELLSVFS